MPASNHLTIPRGSFSSDTASSKEEDNAEEGLPPLEQENKGVLEFFLGSYYVLTVPAAIFLLFELLGNKCRIPLPLWHVLFTYSWLIWQALMLNKVWVNNSYADAKYDIQRYYYNKFVKEAAIWTQIGAQAMLTIWGY